MAGRRTNLGLFVLLAVSFSTGGLMYSVGTRWGHAAAVAHGVAGVGILMLTPWKSTVVERGLRRNRAGQTASVLLGVLVVAAITTGVLHAAGFRHAGGVLMMQLHVGSALLAFPLAVWHAFARPTRPRRADLSKRNLLRASALTVGASAAYVGLEGVYTVTGARGAERRFTGSHEVGTDDPDEMPVVEWLFDDRPTVDPDEWELTIETPSDTRRLGYRDLLAEPRDDVRAVLDCTGGWWAAQDWQGVPFRRLVGEPGDVRSVVVESVTGYSRRFPAGDLDALVLATHVGGERLSRGHGFPARLVAPGRRGFWWVKWVESIRLERTPWWWQPPFPLQ